MAGEVRTYSPDQLLVIVGGVPMGGYSEDSMVSIEPAADRATSMSGADGEVARSMSTDRRATITLSLMQTSASNDVLSGFAQVDALTGGGVFPVLVQDLRGRTVFAAPQAWVGRIPDVAFGREVGEREWRIDTGPVTTWFIGGNS